MNARGSPPDSGVCGGRLLSGFRFFGRRTHGLAWAAEPHSWIGAGQGLRFWHWSLRAWPLHAKMAGQDSRRFAPKRAIQLQLSEAVIIALKESLTMHRIVERAIQIDHLAVEAERQASDGQIAYPPSLIHCPKSTHSAVGLATRATPLASDSSTPPDEVANPLLSPTPSPLPNRFLKTTDFASRTNASFQSVLSLAARSTAG